MGRRILPVRGRLAEDWSEYIVPMSAAVLEVAAQAAMRRVSSHARRVDERDRPVQGLP